MDPLRLFARAQHVFGSPMQVRRTIPASATPQYRPSSRSAASGRSAVYSLGQALRRVLKWPAASPTPEPLSDPGCGYGPYLASRRLRAAGLEAHRPGQYRAPCQCLPPSRSAVLFAQVALEDRPGLSVPGSGSAPAPRRSDPHPGFHSARCVAAGRPRRSGCPRAPRSPRLRPMRSPSAKDFRPRARPGHCLQTRRQNLGPHEGRDSASRFFDAVEGYQASPCHETKYSF